MEKQARFEPRVICFRRWSRRSWAAFSSMGKHIRIGVLGLTCSLLWVPVHSNNPSDTIWVPASAEVFLLEEVVVSAGLAPVLSSELMRVVQVISRPEIEQAAASDLAGLLATLRSVDIRQRGGFGMQADISIRGGTFDQVLILVNGVNVTDPQTGHHNLNIPLPLQSIERIEVLQGPGARLFGPNAFSGAINIITRSPGTAPLEYSLEGGMYGYGAISAGKGFGTERFRHHLAAMGQRSDGFADNTDFSSAQLFYRGYAALPGFSADFQLAYNAKAFGANSFYTPRFPDQFEEIHTGLGSIQLTSASVPNGKLRLYWRRQYDRFELFRNEAPAWYSGHNYHLGDVAGASLSWQKQWSNGITSVGLDYRHEQIYSTVLGEELFEPARGMGHPYGGYTHFYERGGISFTAEHTYYIGSLSFSGGLLTWVNPQLEKDIAFFPGLDVGWQIQPGLRWYSSFNRTLRLPTFTDLFYEGPSNTGNPGLQPEEALSAETGLKASWGSWRMETSLFRRWGSNMIDWIMSPGDDKWRSMNFTRVNFTGLEVSLQSPAVHLSPDTKPLLFSVHYSYLHADKSAGEFISNYVLDYARQKTDLQLLAPLYRNSGFRLDISRIEREGGYMLFEDGVFTEQRDFAPFWLAHLRLYYRTGNQEFFAEINNLFDTHVVSIANVPQPGRWIRAGVRGELR